MECNPAERRFVQRTVWNLKTGALFACLAGIALAGVEPAPDRVELAVRQIRSGSFPAAAKTVEAALEADPGDPLLYNMAASLMLVTGDVSGAAVGWSAALSDSPEDGLARYGRALTFLAKSEVARAMDELHLAEETGDRAYVLLAQRYLEWLKGAAGSGAGLALPDQFAASTSALSAIAALAVRDPRQAYPSLKEALEKLPGDPFAEPRGLIMTFDRSRPLKFGAQPLPAGHGLAKLKRAAQKPYSGLVMLSGGELGREVGYVAYRIDGRFSSIVNTPPFTLAWDTSRWPNGLHRVEITVYDTNGRQVRQASSVIRTGNANAPPRDAGDGQKAQRVRQALWELLLLKPSRALLAYAAAQSATAVGDAKAAARYLQQTAAIDPQYKDARTRFALLNQGVAEEAIWRGAAGSSLVALTFDDGPKPGFTEQLLAALTQNRAVATFFVVGRDATAYPDLVRKIAEAGMQVENHSYTHPNLTLLTPVAIERELLRTMASIREATGRTSRFFRPPGGNINDEVSRVAAKWGLTPCMWTLNGEALEHGSPDRLVEFIVERASPGAIILLHNGRMTTVEALPRIIEGLRKRGLEFGTIDQVLPQRAVARPTGPPAGARTVR